MTDIDTKERIKLAANELVMKYGVRSVSMDDIAAHLGISKKTIYLYYKDKDELVDAIIESEIARTQDICERDLDISDNAIHEIILAMDMMVEIFHSMNPSLLFDLRKYHPRAFEKFNLHKTTYLFEVMKQNLVRGVNEKLYRPEIHIDIMARFRVESVFIPMAPEFHAGIKSSLLEAEEQLIVHFLFGLVTPKGYEVVVNYLNERNMTTGKTDKKSKVNGY
jgi:AcrR family transcriptional regulator